MRCRREPHLAMAVLTTERVTAFMPALSPPEVRTAIFILGFCGRLVVDACAMTVPKTQRKGDRKRWRDPEIGWTM